MDNSLSLPQAEIDARSFINKVYGWMTAGLVMTGWVAWMIGKNESFIRYMFDNRWLFYALFIAQLVVVVRLSGWVQSMSAHTATVLFLVYSALTGFTLSMIFMLYTASSIASTFFVTAGMFGTMSFYGYVTKRDLTKMGSLMFMALIGLILASVVNIFWANPILYWITTYAGVIIFVGLTAYDTQRIKNMSGLGLAGSEEEQKGAVLGALTLYLDFINMFIYMLRIMGRRK